VNFLDPGPCYCDWDIHVWKEGKVLDLDPTLPWLYHGTIGRDSAGMEAAWEWAASTNLGCTAAGAGHQHIWFIVLDHYA
jgi:hypothetical protein